MKTGKALLLHYIQRTRDLVIYPPENEVEYNLNQIAIEVTELFGVANKVHYRGDKTWKEARENLVLELGDIFFSVVRLADRYGCIEQLPLLCTDATNMPQPNNYKNNYYLIENVRWDILESLENLRTICEDKPVRIAICNGIMSIARKLISLCRRLKITWTEVLISNLDKLDTRKENGTLAGHNRGDEPNDYASKDSIDTCCKDKSDKAKNEK